MRTLSLALLALLAAAPVGARPVRQGDDVARLRAENQALRAAVNDLYDGLDRIDRMSDRLRDRRGAQRIRQVAEDAMDRAEQDGGWGQGEDDDGYDSGGGYAVNVDDLVAHIQAAGTSDAQLALVKAASQGSFYVADVVKMMKACSYEDTRIEVAAMLYPRIVDPGNWYQVADGFSYQSSFDTLRGKLGQ